MICDLNITTVNEDYPYELDFQLQINVTLNQYGFPIEGMVIKSSPISSAASKVLSKAPIPEPAIAAPGSAIALITGFWLSE